MTEDIRHADKLLARYIPAAAWKPGLSFFTEDQHFIQVGSWNYASGKELQAHVHNRVDRAVERTQEVVYVRKGRLLASVYAADGTLVREVTVSAGDTIVLFDGGHGYRILEDGTEVLEVKNGPYPGAEADRTRIATKSL
jgi:oxalate decarboxylase/phosphoglucose isomerase-like protein (cupin superfamily)